MIKPVCLGCGHSGCKACIQELISNARSRRCPACREAVDASQIRDNVALGQMISELRVHCLSSGCDWKGTYGNAANHHSCCPKFRLRCQKRASTCVGEKICQCMPHHAFRGKCLAQNVAYQYKKSISNNTRRNDVRIHWKLAHLVVVK